MTVYYLELNNPQHAQSLFQVLRNTSKRRFWPADKDIKVGDDVLYRLHNRIVAVDSDVEGEVIYKSLSSHTLSKTKSSHIFEVELSFKFSSTGDICFLEHRPQIAKLITKPDCAIFTNFQQLVTTEYLISKDIKHLGVFSPIFRRNKALLVMNKMSGVELYYFIHKVLSQDINLTAQFIFMLTEALFKAFEEQVLAYQISHHDLKPENMLLNTECYLRHTYHQLI